MFTCTGSRNGQNLFDTMAGLKAARPGLKIMVTGSGDDDETILKALAAGATGYVEEAASPLEFVQASVTAREKEVLELLVASRSNKEIGSALGITERTVKAHVAKLLRRVCVQNRIALSVHAITHCLVIAK